MDKLAELEKELLADMEENPVEYKETVNNVFEIDSNLRTINIPVTVKNIGVESDDDVKRLEFTMPKQYGEFDLSQFRIRINYMNANGDKSIYLVEDKTVTGDNITFSWLVGRNVTKYKGKVNFIVCLKLSDEKGKILKELNTTLCRLEVLEGLEVVPVIDEKTTDIIEQLLRMVETKTTGVVQKVAEEGSKQVKEVQKAAQEITADREQIQKNTESVTALKEDLNVLTEEVVLSDNDFDNVFDGVGYINDSTDDIVINSDWKYTTKYYPLRENDSGNTYIYLNLSSSTTGIEIIFYNVSKKIIGFKPLANVTDTGLNLDGVKYFRLYSKKNNDVSVYVSRKRPSIPVKFNYEIGIIVKEKSIPPDFNNNYLRNKIIVNFGDSLFGNYRGIDSISSHIENFTFAKVYNCGFGGCKMAKEQTSSPESDEAWNAFAMYNLANSISKKDFTLQERVKNYDGSSGGQALPKYFSEETLPLLKSIDFSKVDLITIAYGTNDYQYGTDIEDTAEGFDTSTYLGALKYSVKKIQETYPLIKILVITPVWRYFSTGEESDTYNWKGKGTLSDYKNALIKECGLLHIPCLDSYSNLQLSKYNANTLFEDYTHLNQAGRKMYAELIVGKIRTLY